MATRSAYLRPTPRGHGWRWALLGQPYSGGLLTLLLSRAGTLAGQRAARAVRGLLVQHAGQPACRRRTQRDVSRPPPARPPQQGPAPAMAAWRRAEVGAASGHGLQHFSSARGRQAHDHPQRGLTTKVSAARLCRGWTIESEVHLARAGGARALPRAWASHCAKAIGRTLRSVMLNIGGALLLDLSGWPGWRARPLQAPSLPRRGWRAAAPAGPWPAPEAWSSAAAGHRAWRARPGRRARSSGRAPAPIHHRRASANRAMAPPASWRSRGAIAAQRACQLSMSCVAFRAAPACTSSRSRPRRNLVAARRQLGRPGA